VLGRAARQERQVKQRAAAVSLGRDGPCEATGAEREWQGATERAKKKGAACLKVADGGRTAERAAHGQRSSGRTAVEGNPGWICFFFLRFGGNRGQQREVEEARNCCCA
jgi:hypothetical protein